jgi:hypothetical protein
MTEERPPLLSEAFGAIRSSLLNPDAPATQAQIATMLISLAGVMDVVGLMLPLVGARMMPTDLEETRKSLDAALDALNEAAAQVDPYYG